MRRAVSERRRWLRRCVRLAILVCATAGALLPWLIVSEPPVVSAVTQILDETFTRTSTTPGLFTSGGGATPGRGFACLTAGNAATPATSIPACPGGPIDSDGNGALRLTRNVANQAGFALYNAILPANSGLLVNFDMFQYASGGIGAADGIGFFLIEPTASPTTAGGFGGSLGYAQNTARTPAEPGLVGGYIGIGFDAFGNYSNPTEGRVGGPGFTPNAIAVRGVGSGLTGYPYLLGVKLPPTVSLVGTNRTNARRHVQVSISTANVLTIRVDFPGRPSVTLGPVDLNNTPGNPAFPSQFKFGFAASTGGGFDIHEVRNLVVRTVPPDLTIVKTHDPGAFTAGQNGSFTLTVSNSAAAGPTTGDVTVTDVLPAGLTATSASGNGWTCNPQAGATVTCSHAATGSETLAAGDALPPITVQVAVAANAPTGVTNTATVSTVDDSNALNNQTNDTVSIIQIADLRLTKRARPATVKPGDDVTYELTVTNDGPGVAIGATVSDQVSTDLTDVAWVCTAALPSTCDTTSGLGDINNAAVNLVANGSATFTVTGRVSEDAALGSLANQATVSVPSTVIDPNPGNNTASAAITVDANPMIGLAKTVATPVDVGGGAFDIDLSYVVKNYGDVPLTNVRLRDDLATTFDGAVAFSVVPGSLSATGGLTVNPNFNGTTDALLVTGGSLAVDASATVKVTVRVTPGSTITYSNSAKATGTGPGSTTVEDDSDEGTNPDEDGDGDPTEPGENDPTLIVFSGALADLEIAKTGAPDPVVVGQNVTYRLTATNHGPANATNVVVHDLLPATLTLVSSTASQGSCSGNSTITCELGRLSNGASATITIVARADVAGTASNAAAITGDQPDSVPSNNSDSDSTSITPLSDLSVTKTATPDPASIGDLVTFTMTATNHGPSPATNVTLTDALPTGVDFISATPSQGAACTTVASRISCPLGALAPDASATVTIVVRPTTFGSFMNTTGVSGNELDPDSADNGSTAGFNVEPPSDPPPIIPPPTADLRLTKTATPPQSTVGNQITYTLAVTNLSDATASNVVVRDTLPLNTVFLSATPSQGACTADPPNAAGAVVVCDLATLPGQATATITLVVRSLAPGTLVNQASSSGDLLDPDNENNGAIGTVTVTIPPSDSTPNIPLADLEVTKVVKPASGDDVPSIVFDPRQSITYTSTITNHGPATATNVVFADTLAPGLTFVRATASQGGACTTSGSTRIRCNLGDLAVGATASVEVTARADAQGVRVNAASASSNEADPNTVNNGAVVSVVVTGEALPPSSGSDGLSIAKTASTLSPTVGDPVTYTLTVTNTGSVPLDDVVVDDPLPAGLLLSSVTTSEGSCSGTTTIQCRLGTLNAGRTATITIVVRTTTEGAIGNTATANAPEVNPAQASVTITVGAAAPRPEPNDDKDEERDAERRRAAEQRQNEIEQTETEGTVVAVMCSPNAPRPPAPVAEDDGEDAPYVVIVTLDGNQKVRLRKDAVRACTSIRIGAYLEAVGEKQHEYLFDADDVKIRDGRPRP